MPDLAELQPSGKIRFNLHPGQWKAWNSHKRFISVIAGTQGGKTSFGPHWLLREMQMQGPGDYMVVTPTFALAEKKLLPEFLKVFDRWYRLGKYFVQRRCYTLSEEGSLRIFGSYDPERPTNVWFGYAENPESLESATAKAAWLDEAGQKKFRLSSWEAILRRLSLAQGRVLITTTPYDLGWLKQHIYDPWRKAKNEGELEQCEIDCIRFDSTENPNFPQAEFDRARRTLPSWKFNLFYRGIFTRPAGMIYDSFRDTYTSEGGHLIKPFRIPTHWKRAIGVDFGGVNTAATYYANKPGTRTWYLYRTYHAGERSAKEHIREMFIGEPPPSQFMAYGGAKSEGQWRREFKKEGLNILEPPVSDVEVGIDRVYAAHRDDQIIVFSTLSEYREEKTTYSREVDDSGNPTEKIENKNQFHLIDSERYIISRIRGGIAGASGAVDGRRESVESSVQGIR